MATGILAAACVCLALGQSPDVTYLNYRQVEVPVVVDPAQQSGIREILLYASDDLGRSWSHVAGPITPDKKHFAYYPKGDGLYWLRVVMINRNGVQSPNDLEIKNGPPDMKIVIDTLKPIVRSFQAQRLDDDVYVSWELQEDNLDAKNLRLEYQIKDAVPEAWKSVPITAGLKGQAKFAPGHKQPLTLRIIARDLAKNESYGAAEVAGSIVAAGFGGVGPTAPLVAPQDNFPPRTNIDTSKPMTIPPLNINEPKEIPPPKGPGTTVPGIGAGNMIPPPIAIENPADKGLFTKPMSFGAPPPVGPGPGAMGADRQAISVSNEKVIADSSMPPPVVAPKIAPKEVAPLPGMQPKDGDVKPIANAVPAKKPLVALQYINQHQVMLEYELKRVGPSGIGGIEVWLTKNDGETWEPFAADEDVQSGAINRRQQRKFDLRDAGDRPFADGIYGLSLVVKNRAGMGKKPRPGDAPELRIEIDTQLPDAQLFMPVADPQNPDHVMIKWSAKDKNLVDRPISLEYAARPDGEWLPIKLDLENSGKSTNDRVTGDFSWKVPANTPVQVYLRMRVRDKAGNERVLVTPQPQFVDLTEPEGALIGVQPNSKN